MMTERLTQYGFTPTTPTHWTRDGYRLDLSGAWWTLRAPGELAADWLDRPGPWSCDPAGRPTCDLPALDIEQALACVEWAWEMRDHEAPADQPDVEWRRDHLTVRRGDLVRRATVRGARVEFELATVPAALPPSRRGWLDAVLADARRARCARIGVDPASRVVACLDVSGCPRDVAQSHADRATAALAAAVERLLPALTVLTDVSVTSRALQLDALAPFNRDRE